MQMKSEEHEAVPYCEKEYHGELIPPESDDFTSTDNLFNYQAKIIRDLAKEESCVIIGRCADYVLKDYPNVLSVLFMPRRNIVWKAQRRSIA